MKNLINRVVLNEHVQNVFKLIATMLVILATVVTLVAIAAIGPEIKTHGNLPDKIIYVLECLIKVGNV